LASKINFDMSLFNKRTGDYNLILSFFFFFQLKTITLNHLFKLVFSMCEQL